MTSADVRARLARALRLDLIGPEPDEPQVIEVLGIAPSRWYLAGFLVPWNAPAAQKKDEEDTQGELEFGEAGGSGEDDESTPEPRAARRSHLPSSIGISVLLPAEARQLKVGVRWGDYRRFAVEKDGTTSYEWRRTERTAVVVLALTAEGPEPASQEVPQSEGLEIVSRCATFADLTNCLGCRPVRAHSRFS